MIQKSKSGAWCGKRWKKSAPRRHTCQNRKTKSLVMTFFDIWDNSEALDTQKSNCQCCALHWSAETVVVSNCGKKAWVVESEQYWLLHRDNVPAHYLVKTLTFLPNHQMTTLEHLRWIFTSHTIHFMPSINGKH